MKKILFSMLVGVSQLAFSQQLISFEASEGYTAANIDTQQGWATSANGVGLPNISGQKVSAEQFADGARSLKITKEAALIAQTSPVVGAFKPIGSFLEYNNFTISFDIRFTEKGSTASQYEFQTLGNGPLGRIYVIRLRFNKTGEIVVAQTTGTSSTLATTTGTWNANTWYRVKIVGTATGLTYYLNDTQIYTGNFFNNYNFDEMTFVHDNYSGSAYVDKIAINNEGGVLSTKDDVKMIKNRLSIYPNPTSDVLNIKTDSKINSVSVVDITGKKVNVKLENDKIDVRNLPAGIYLVNIETKDGISTEKFIKK
ncbi:T9SS type A sorting domain-containing protein [Chryseobacterium turcicum]|uniref:T9SS type A sorting domain-containing protein n=1 Tax=Chryseobacterium turcicum TaxID=2898076 RepID=A0A9Q3V4N5_9FLAO|nr:T9SS type A sorting domain-containing protein [Chryseobacterium turcicum]MCD1117034.1 T9SS type A sorting domain-containing protein [Chryseobacterium turcicum]